MLYFGSEMSLKGPYVKDLVPSLALLGGSGAFKMWGLVRGLQVTGSVPQKGTVEPKPFLSLSLCFLAMR
jgi:hypothetical protein